MSGKKEVWRSLRKKYQGFIKSLKAEELSEWIEAVSIKRRCEV